MKNKMFKKILALTTALTMVVGMCNVVLAAHAANGANVGKGTWTSFSIHSREDGGKWEDALIKEGQSYNASENGYATYGWIPDGAKTSSSFDWYIESTGWDGTWNTYTTPATLLQDCPWGLTAQMTNVPVEKGRYYTISFKIKSTLSRTDEKTGIVYDKKAIVFKAYRPTAAGDNPGIDFSTINVTGGTIDDNVYIILTKDQEATVTATLQVPTKGYDSSYMGVQFAAGAVMKTYPTDVAMKGYIYLSDYKVIAGNQYTVKYTNGSSTYTTYANAGGTAPRYTGFTKKGYNLAGYKNAATGATYNFSSKVNSNITLAAVWTKTPTPAKVKVTAKSTAKKKVKVSYKKVKNAKGYSIKYSTKKNMKGAKTKNTTKTSYTLKKLKSRKYVYIKVQAYNYDSAGKKVLGKISARKRVFVK